jgi:hypothetical protein
VLSIPYNLVGVSERKLGLDAFFWTRLDLPYRRVLLVRDSRALGGVFVGGCCSFIVKQYASI